MTPELAAKILQHATDPYLQSIIDDIYRIWGHEALAQCIGNYRARQIAQPPQEPTI